MFNSIDEFKVIRKLGEGSVANVYLGHHIDTKQQYSLKFVEDHDKQYVMKNLDFYLTIDHENLMKIYGYFDSNVNNKNYLIIVMEYIEGDDLFDAMAEWYLEDLDYPVNINVYDMIDSIVKQIVAGLKYLHDLGYIHRDIKLENIMITPDNTIKIIDYDFLIHENDGYCVPAGTPIYAAPEVIKYEYVDKRVDLWALGILIYALLNDDYPFDSDDQKELYKKIVNNRPDTRKMKFRYAMIVEGLLDKDPDKRMSLDNVLKLLG